MAFDEDLSVFLNDFGVSVVAGSKRGLGILDMPSEIVADGQVLTTDYQLTCLSSVFGTLSYNDTLTVDGAAYLVRENMRVDDGKFCTIMLTKS
jgi:hypothetical protein